MVGQSSSLTPLAPSEPAAIGYPAGLGRRLGAALYDVLLVVALWMTTLFVWVAAGDGEAVSGWPVQVVLLAEFAGFYLLSWSRRGQTLGMAAWKIKVVTEQGGAPSIDRLALRLLCAPLSILPLGMGYLWFYVGSRQQTWHDRLSGTMVVHIPKSSDKA